MLRRGIVLRWRPAEMSVTVYQSTRSRIPAGCMLVRAYVLPNAMQSAAAYCACQTTELCSRTAVATIGDVADCTEVRKWKCLFVNDSECKRPINAATSGVPRGGGLGCSNPPPPEILKISVGVLDRISKKNRRLDFLL